MNIKKMGGIMKMVMGAAAFLIASNAIGAY